MVYTPDEKRRMDRLLDAFSFYIRDSREIDVAYSEKTGYVRLIIDEGADAIFFPITSFDDLLGMIIDDFLADEEYRVNDYMRIDYDRVRRILTPIFASLPEDGDFCIAFMDGHFRKWQQRCQQMHRDVQEDLRQLSLL